MNECGWSAGQWLIGDDDDTAIGVRLDSVRSNASLLSCFFNHYLLV